MVAAKPGAKVGPSQFRSENIWTLTQARRHFYALIGAAIIHPQIVTRRGVPSYLFAAESPSKARRRKKGGVVVVRAIRKGKD